MRIVGGLVSALFLLLAATPAGADNAATLAAIKEHLQKADPQPIRKLLTPAVREELAKVPKDAAAACRLAVIYARSTTESTSDPEDMVPILEAFVDIGTQSVALDPKEVLAHVALARARRSLCRHRLAEDGIVRPAEWREVADTWLQAARCKGGAIRTLDAFLALLEGAAAGEEHRDAILAQAEEIARAEIAADANPLQASAGLAEVRFAQARRLFEAGEKKEAAAAVQEARSLALVLDVKGGPVRGRAQSILNRTTRFLRESKIDRKAAFLTRERKTRWHYLRYELPWGNHWSVKHTKSKDAQTMTTLKRSEELTRPGTTYVIFKRFKWGTEYTSDDGGVGGDNPRGLLERDREGDHKWLKEVTREKKLMRGKLNRAIKKTSGYEIQGIDKDHDRWWIRTWFFKSEDRSRTFCVRVSHYGQDPGLDPEVQHLLDSIREVPEEE